MALNATLPSLDIYDLINKLYFNGGPQDDSDISRGHLDQNEAGSQCTYTMYSNVIKCDMQW